MSQAFFMKKLVVLFVTLFEEINCAKQNNQSEEQPIDWQDGFAEFIVNAFDMSLYPNLAAFMQSGGQQQSQEIQDEVFRYQILLKFILTAILEATKTTFTIKSNAYQEADPDDSADEQNKVRFKQRDFNETFDLIKAFKDNNSVVISKFIFKFIQLSA
jgi:hypothetical protein